MAQPKTNKIKTSDGESANLETLWDDEEITIPSQDRDRKIADVRNIDIRDEQSDERALRECILCKIGLTDWVIYLVDWQWQRSRTQSIGPNDSIERCAMSIVLFRINIAAITENTWPWPFIFDLDLFPWPLTLIFDLEIDLLLPWCFEENITKMYCFDVTWRKNGTSFVRTETNLPISILSETFCNQPEVSTTSGSKVMAQKVILMVFDVFDLDLDISRSFDFWEFTICYRARLV